MQRLSRGSCCIGMVLLPALPATSTALTSLAIRRKLRREWRFIGEVNRMHAFARPGKAVCHLKWDDGWRLFAGAVSPKELDEIAQRTGY